MLKLKSGKIRGLLIVITLAVLSYCSLSAYSTNQQDYNYIPKEGYVPDSVTAVKIAEAVWMPIYGITIYRSRPFIAKLSKDKKVWTVTGTFNRSEPDTVKGDTVIISKGGAPYVEISKQDCRILRLYHGE
jgi:hypothetical protein